jgi:hypothetical protein
LLVSTPGEGDARRNGNFLLATNTHDRFCAVPAGSGAGSISDPNSLPDYVPAQFWKDEQLSQASSAERCYRKSDRNASIAAQGQHSDLHPGSATAASGPDSVFPDTNATTTAQIQHPKSHHTNAIATQIQHSNSRHTNSATTAQIQHPKSHLTDAITTQIQHSNSRHTNAATTPQIQHSKSHHTNATAD